MRDWDDDWKWHQRIAERIAMWVVQAAVLLWLGYEWGLRSR